MKTLFGWGAISEIRDGDSVIITLEDFAGWSGKAPFLSTSLSNAIVLHVAMCAVGSRVRTKYGSGVLINYMRSSGIYVVRMWNTVAKMSGSGVAYMPRDEILAHYTQDQTPGPEFNMRGLRGELLSDNEACALPTVELIFSALPNNAGIHRTALDLITNIMMRLDENVNASTDGEGIVVNLDDEGAVFDTSSLFKISKVKDFLSDIRRQVRGGEKVVMQHIVDSHMDPAKVTILYDHWKRVSCTIQDICTDFEMLFAAEAEEGDSPELDRYRCSDASLGSEGFVSLSSDNIYEFICKLRTHVSSMRIYFDLTDDSIDSEGLEIISGIISDFRENVFKPFQMLPEMLMKKLKSIVPLPDTSTILSNIGVLDRRGLVRRVGLIITKMSPSTNIFSSTPNLASFRDLEDLLTAICEFFEKSNLPGILMRGLRVKSATSLKELIAMDLGGASTGEIDLSISVDDLKQLINTEGTQLAEKVSSIDLYEFRDMIQHLVVSIKKSNPNFSGYGLRKKLLDSPQIGLVLLICHLYQAKELKKLPLVKSILDSIPAGLKMFLSSYLLSSNNNSVESTDNEGGVTNYVTLNDIVFALEQFDEIAETLLSGTDQIVTGLEHAQTADAYQFALAHLSTLDINIADSARNLVLSSNMMESKEGLPPDLLSAAEVALTDERARTRLIDSVKDNILDFLVSYIPTINIASLDGVHENIEYSISGLDLSGFRFDKNCVTMDVEDNLASGKDLLSFVATDITAKFSSVQWKYKKLTFPYLSGQGTANAFVERASIKLGFKIVRLPKGVSEQLAGDLGPYKEFENHVSLKFPDLAHEVARLRQPSLPIFNRANSPLRSNRDIWENVTDWEPVLLISQKAIDIDSLTLDLRTDGYMTWLYNMLASVFSNLLKDKICAALTGLISSSSSELLSVVNGAFAAKWDILQRVVKYDIGSVPSCSTVEFISLVGDEVEQPSAKLLPPREWTLKFQEEGPLGLNLNLIRENVEAMIVSRTEVGSIVLGTQAHRVCDALGWPPFFLNGSTVMSVNGARLSNSSKEYIYELLSNRRPLFLSIKLSDAGFEKLRRHTEDIGNAAEEEASKYAYVTFQNGPLGIVLVELDGPPQMVMLRSFSRGERDTLLQAEASGKIAPGFVLLAINGQVLLGKNLAEIQIIIMRSTRPIKVLFARDRICAAATSTKRIKEMFA